jgi:hypothetical protein
LSASSINVPLAIATALSAATWAIHTFVGGPRLTPPLLQAPLQPVVQLTHYYCWHLVTMMLGMMALGFGYATFVASGLDVAVFVTALSLGAMAWSMALTVWKQRRVVELPQWILFASINVFAIAGLR